MNVNMKLNNYIIECRYYTVGKTEIPVKALTPDEAKTKAIKKFNIWNKDEPKKIIGVEIKQ